MFHLTSWSATDPQLYTKAFTGPGKAHPKAWCDHCLTSSHLSSECPIFLRRASQETQGLDGWPHPPRQICRNFNRGRCSREDCPADSLPHSGMSGSPPCHLLPCQVGLPQETLSWFPSLHLPAHTLPQSSSPPPSLLSPTDFLSTQRWLILSLSPLKTSPFSHQHLHFPLPPPSQAFPFSHQHHPSIPLSLTSHPFFLLHPTSYWQPSHTCESKSSWLSPHRSPQH